MLVRAIHATASGRCFSLENRHPFGLQSLEPLQQLGALGVNVAADPAVLRTWVSS